MDRLGGLQGFPGLPGVLPPTPRCRPSCHSYQLAQRTFRTFDFYKKHQEAMTPAGLAFFQCRWDDSVTHTFHQLLGKGILGLGGLAGLKAKASPALTLEAKVGSSWQEFTPSLYFSCRHAGTCV